MIFTLLSSVIHLTNLTFLPDEETDGVQIDDEFTLRVGKHCFQNLPVVLTAAVVKVIYNRHCTLTMNESISFNRKSVMAECILLSTYYPGELS